MAQGQQDRTPILKCRMNDEGLRESFEDFATRFESDSEAMREALREGIDSYEPEETSQQAGQSVIAGAAVAILVVAVGQTFLTAGGVPAAGLTLVAIGAAGLGTQLPLERIA